MGGKAEFRRPIREEEEEVGGRRVKEVEEVEGLVEERKVLRLRTPASGVEKWVNEGVERKIPLRMFR